MTVPYRFPFKKLEMSPRGLQFIEEACASGHLSSDGAFTRHCEDWLRERHHAAAAILVQSCTAGLEVAMALAGIGPGAEVILPSFAFPSAANAIALRGGVPVFADIRADTLNLDERLVEAAITPVTKAILCVDYGGVCAEFDALGVIARRHGLFLIEDAAHAFQSTYRGEPVGRRADIAALSFHDTKDVTSGEGGALILNRPDLVLRVAAIADKGTNRQEFLAGRTNFYSWVAIGHSAKPSEITAGFLWAQFQDAQGIRDARVAAWNAYHAALASVEAQGLLRRPLVPPHCVINGNCYYVILPEGMNRSAIIADLAARGIEAKFHFIPLHSALAGKRHGRVVGAMVNTDAAARRILRLPMWSGIAEDCGEIAGELGDCLAANLR